MSMKNSNDTIGNRTRDLPTCNAVPQPTAPPLNWSAIETCLYLYTGKQYFSATTCDEWRNTASVTKVGLMFGCYLHILDWLVITWWTMRIRPYFWVPYSSAIWRFPMSLTSCPHAWNSSASTGQTFLKHGIWSVSRDRHVVQLDGILKY